MGSIDGLIKILQDLKECTSLEEAKSLKEKVTRKCKRRKIDEGSRKYSDVEDKEVHTLEENKMLNLEQVVKSMKDLKVQVKELFDRGAFPYGVTLDDPDRLNNVEFVIPTIVGEMFYSNEEKIRECLMRNEVSRIGICGMGGVGKTTLVQYLHNKVLNIRSTFGNVYWVTVSKVCSIDKLQNKIANVIAKGLLNGVDVDDEAKRAALLAKAVKKKENFVLFLDDMWNSFDLKKVGILENVKCKLVLTARSKEVCHRMGCDENNIIKVDPLSEENAWNLFVEYHSTHDIQKFEPNIEAIAKEMVKECSGLPLGIITLARSMRGTEDICEWNDKLSKLKRSEAELKAEDVDVFPILRFSYDRLDDSQLQECLLYCALYPEDYEIRRDELIWGFIDKGLIKYEKEHTMEEMMNEGHTILNKLERACLLTSIKSEIIIGECMKMHDLIRDMALQVSGSKFMVKAGIGLKDFPSALTEAIEVVSLMLNDLSEISDTPDCQKLRVMLLQYNLDLWRIPNDFFKQIHGLTVVDLSVTSIEVLPESISDLIHLTALILQACQSLKVVPSLEKLTVLRRLNLSWTMITEIPRGLEKLLNLKYLNLEECSSLKQFPIEFLLKLSRLQYLNLKRCNYYASANELMSMKNLEFFIGHMSQITYFNSYVKHMKRYHRLKKYSIVVVPSFDNDFSSSQFDRNVTLKDCKISNCRGEFPKDIQSLKIKDCDLETSLDSPASKQYLFSSPSGLLLFPDLKYLFIMNLRNLYGLFERGTGSSCTLVIDPQSSFSNLKSIAVYDCPEITYLFTTKEIQYLPNIEEIDVCKCLKLKNIIMDVDEVEEDACTDTCCLPKLIFSHLSNLPILESICSGKRVSISSVSLKKIMIRNCPKLKRMSLSLPINLSPTSFLGVDVDDMQMWESLEWDQPDAKRLLETSVRLHQYPPILEYDASSSSTSECNSD